MTVGEVYDYNIGDVFIRKVGGFSAPPTYVKWIITNKYFSGAADTVFYVSDNWSFTWPSTTDSSFGNLFYYTDLNDTIGTGLGTKPDNIYCIDTNGYTGAWLDTVYYNPYICNVLTTRIAFMENGPILTDTCWWYFEPFWGHLEYSKGLGQNVFYYNTCSQGFPNCEVGNSLVYYKKGNDSCGTAPIMTAVEQNMEKNILSLFPNPTHTNFSVDQTGELKVYDVAGRLVKEQIVSKVKAVIDCKDLQEGIYFVKVNDGEKVFTQKLIKQ
jgi:hypothetical protein